MQRIEYRFKVSQFCHYAFCPKRCKIELFNQLINSWDGQTNKAMVKGTEMHSSYNSWAKSFDRMQILYDLKYSAKLPYTRGFITPEYSVQMRGLFDDIRVIRDTHSNEKLVSFVELKTTSKQRMWSCEVDSAILQLQIYLWIMRPYIERLGWQMHSRHYVEIFSQRSGRLIKRITVYEDPDMQERICYILRAFQGLEKVQFPSKSSVCRICPKYIKSECDWFQR